MQYSELGVVDPTPASCDLEKIQRHGTEYYGWQLLSGIFLGLLLAYCLSYFKNLSSRFAASFDVLALRTRLGAKQPDNDLEDDTHFVIRAFEASIDQINMMQEGGDPLGMLVARGQDLKIVRVNQQLRNMLKWGADEIVAPNVCDVLPPPIRVGHASWVGSACKKNAFPHSLEQPLRAVSVLRADGKEIKCNISLGVLTKSLNLAHPRSLFYALLSEVDLSMMSPAPELEAPAESDENSEEEEECAADESWHAVADQLYGRNVSDVLANGELPPPEMYESATVLCLDVVEFTKTCMSMAPSDVASWMSGVYATIEELLHTHSVRKIETRGDCYVVCAGTVFCEGDAPETQVSRIVAFASQLNDQLQVNGTKIRVGIAYGPITVAFIGTHQLAPTMCVIGDTADMAATMEHTGNAGEIHLTDRCARKLCEERGWKPGNVGLLDAGDAGPGEVEEELSGRRAELSQMAWFYHDKTRRFTTQRKDRDFRRFSI